MTVWKEGTSAITVCLSLFVSVLSFSLSVLKPPLFSDNKPRRQFNPVSDAFTLSLLCAHKRGNQGKSSLPLGLSAALSPLIIGWENIFESETTLSFFFLPPDRMTKLIFLSVALTAFKRTLSYHSSCPPYPDPSISSQLLSGRVRKEQLANTFCHFTDPPSFTLLSPPSSHLSLLLPSGGKRAKVFYL